MKNIPPSLRKILNKDKKHKYGAQRTMCLYGHNHDSKKESVWCIKLNELQKEKKIFNLQIEVCFDLEINGELICRHYPDFYYQKNVPDEVNAVYEIIDVKGIKTPEWKLKHKLFCVLYPWINYVVV